MWERLLSYVSWLRCAWARRHLDEDVRYELDAHIDLLTDRYLRSGLTPDEAYTAARRQLGNTTLVRQEIYDMNSIAWVEGLTQDVRYALRQLRRSPGFAAVVVATLALGIGGTTAVFSVVQAVLLAPLPYEEPGQLVRLYLQEPDDPSTRASFSGPQLMALRDEAASFEDVAGLYTYSETGLDLVEDGQAERLRVLEVTSDYFRTLRSGPLRGPGFDRDDEVGTPRVVLSDGLWRTRFDGDPSILGATIHLSGEPYEVVGIAPQDFEDPLVGHVDAWLPYDLVGDTFDQNYSVTTIGRLRSGVNVEQARAELDALNPSIAERWPRAERNTVVALPLKEDLVATSRAPLQLLLVAVGLVLLVACVNVANLVLVRATGRLHEFAIRAALGSGGVRIARQLLVESGILAVLGGSLGLVLAGFGVNVLTVLGSDGIPRLDDVGFDPAVLGFAVAVTLATAVVSGVAPAVRFGGIDPNRTLSQQSRSATGARGHGRLRSGLAAAQLALALTLLVGAGALMASFHRLQQVDLGFRVERVLTFDVSVPTVRYDAEQRAAFQEELARRIETIPGATAAGGTSRLPATGSYHPWGTQIESGPLAGTCVCQPLKIQQRTVSGDFFAALEIPLLAGRTFDARDDANAPSRAVVSARFARRAFPDMPFEDAIGQRITSLGEFEREIIGVVGDVTLDPYGTPTLIVYHAHRQFASNRNWALSQVVATELPPERILPAVLAEVAALDPELVVHRTAPMAEVVGREISRERFALVLMVAFAVVALMLAALGLYGVLAYAVRQRTREIGIRIALGATAAHVRALVLRQAAVVVGIGLVVGIAGAHALGRALASLLFETSASDRRVLVATAVLLTVVALLAACLPAWRASRVEPRIAIQEE
ncbi:MAG: FtsX-like permease family protein [Luteitalea sp.]|nr:FtsX-like permease family protein [Luteitalea sp.]